MSSITGLQCLRPYLFRDLPVARRLVYARFYNTTRRLAAQVGSAGEEGAGVRDISPGNGAAAAKVKGRSAVEQRIEELKAANALVYPRIQRNSSAIGFQEYTKRYGNLKAGVKLDEVVTIQGILVETLLPWRRQTDCCVGRVLSVRLSGKKLVFLDIVQDGQVLQAICSLGNFTSPDIAPFRTFSHLVRRGDIVCKCECLASNVSC
jgi:hypothetical protein